MIRRLRGLLRPLVLRETTFKASITTGNDTGEDRCGTDQGREEEGRGRERGGTTGKKVGGITGKKGEALVKQQRQNNNLYTANSNNKIGSKLQV